MRFCVVGAGAIGGFMGARLALSGEDVTLIARGPHLEAIRNEGLRLITGGREEIARCIATDNWSDAGHHDVVILALKAHQIAGVAHEIRELFHATTVVVTVQNGIPWWYFHKHGGVHDGHRLESLDPDGTIEASIEVDRVIGSIAYPATEKTAPGVIEHIEGNRFPLGELDGSKSERAQEIGDLLTKAGFKSRVITDIRSQVWLKGWGNLSFNPISALTRATLEDICRFVDTRTLAARMMEEAKNVAEALGVTFRITIEQRIAGAEQVGAHKTSMLQDLEAGRSLETEALIGAVVELGRLTGVATPSIDAVYACVKLLDTTTRR